MMRLLMVTEDSDAKIGLGESLVLYGFTYSIVTCDQAPSRIAQSPYDLVLIEIDHAGPGSTAWELISSLKKERRIPIVALLPAGILDEIVDLDVDDFITAPLDVAELALRAKRLLNKADSRASRELIRSDGLMIDLVTCEVAVGGQIIELTFKEYEMLKLLASNPGRVYTREQLLDKVWGYDYFGGDRTVDVHIRRLRSKIEDAHHTFIETVRNIGYRFRKEH